MTKPTRKQIILIIAAILIVVAIIYGFMPEAVRVETATVESAPLQVTVEEEGETRVKQLYTISSPVAAFVRRINLEPGDVVEEGTPLAELALPPSTLLDPRTQAEAEARVTAAAASLEQAETQAEQAISERNRIERLAGKGAATQQQLEQAQTEAARAVAARNAARAELAVARARVGIANEPGRLPVGQVLRAPVSGRILAVHRRSEGYVNAGEPLIEIGDIDGLEVRVDVLSQDAVRISPGTRVVLDQWGGEEPLEARVTRVEPQGKVEVSALGVEERRVEVIAAITSPPDQWTNLGTGYRVLAQFIIWEDENVRRVPASALFRTEDGWATFVVEDGKTVRQAVNVGRRAGLYAQVLGGLSEGDVVVVHPGSEVSDGTDVEAN